MYSFIIIYTCSSEHSPNDRKYTLFFRRALNIHTIINYVSKRNFVIVHNCKNIILISFHSVSKFSTWIFFKHQFSNNWLIYECIYMLCINTRSTTWVIFDSITIAEPNAPVTFNHLWGCTTHQNFIPLAHLEVWKIYLLYEKSRGMAKSGTASVKFNIKVC